MPYSYTSLKTYLTCPRQYQARYIEKSMPYVQSPQAARGDAIHKQLEGAIRDGIEVNVWTPPGLMTMLQQAGASPEQEYAITSSGTPCGWWDPACFLRGKIDVDLPTLMIDWKTGKYYPDPMQADVYATLKRATEGKPKLPLTFIFVYIDLKITHPEEPDVHARERVMSIIEAIEADRRFNPVPCFACGFCNHPTCEYKK